MAQKVSTNIDIKMLARKLTKNLGWVFLAIFLFLLVLEGFEINNSVQIVLGVGQTPPDAKTEKGVRINFDSYKTIVDRINAAPNFTPDDTITVNPFATGH